MKTTVFKLGGIKSVLCTSGVEKHKCTTLASLSRKNHMTAQRRFIMTNSVTARAESKAA